MLYLVALLFGLLAAFPAWAQSNQTAEPPPGQTLLNGLIGKDQTSPSKTGKPVFGGSADQETKEQREHYKNKVPHDAAANKAVSTELDR